MSIKIFPEKVSSINSHKTRKKITNSTFASKQLIYKAVHLKNTIEIANKELSKIDLPYLNDTEVVFYSPEKLILETNIEILKTKIRELHSQFIEVLKTHTLFSNIQEIQIKVSNNKSMPKKIKVINTKAKYALKKIKKEIL